jgi:uncharacterized protein YjlB
VKVFTHLLEHPRWPLLIYPGAGAEPVSALFLEDLFTKNLWPAAWRNGVHPFHHYHSNSHEVLGVYSGEVTVRFGGEGGVTVTAKPGDVIVLPAGTWHKKLASRGALGVVGAYPAGSNPDLCRPDTKRTAHAPLPARDPVYGAGGPLFTYWT